MKDVDTMYATAAQLERFHNTVLGSANLMSAMELQLRGNLVKIEAFKKEKVRPDQSPGLFSICRHEVCHNADHGTVCRRSCWPSRPS